MGVGPVLLRNPIALWLSRMKGPDSLSPSGSTHDVIASKKVMHILLLQCN